MRKKDIFEENKELQSSLFLAQSYQDAWADYGRSLKKERFARWDYVVLTASNEEQAEGFREQIKAIDLIIHKGRVGEVYNDQPLTYEKYIAYMRKSKILMDIPQSTQEGPTTRSFDALLTKTKVVTVNPFIKEYPIYSDNILIVDRNNIVM